MSVNYYEVDRTIALKNQKMCRKEEKTDQNSETLLMRVSHGLMYVD